MTDETRLSLQTLNLSAKQIDQATGWPDFMINDYLTNFANSVILATSSDNLIVQVNQNTADINENEINIGINATNISANTASINTNTGNITTNTNNIAANTLDISDNAANISNNTVNIGVNATNLSNHISDTNTHGAAGNIVGDLNFCTLGIGGVVRKCELVNDAINSTQTITIPDIGAAPATYDQAYTQSVTDLVNDTKAKHNQLVIDFNNLVTQFNDWIAKSKTARQLDT